MNPKITLLIVMFSLSIIVFSMPNVLAASTADVVIPPGSTSPTCASTSTCYIPSSVIIDEGGTVTWTNNSTIHTVTSGVPGTPDGLFNSGVFSSSQTFSHTFLQIGTFDYFCSIHPWMIGSVDVQPIVTTGTITIIKDTNPNNAQNFGFATIGGLIPANFSLDDDADAVLSNTRVYSNVAPGTYTVTEGTAPGFSLTSLVCTDPDNGTTVNLATRAATIDVDSGESITCTFTNTAN